MYWIGNKIMKNIETFDAAHFLIQLACFLIAFVCSWFLFYSSYPVLGAIGWVLSGLPLFGMITIGYYIKTGKLLF